MGAFHMFAGVALTSSMAVIGLALRRVVNPDFQLGMPADVEDRNNPLIMAARWFSGPIAAIATAFCVALRPEVFQAALPSVFAVYAGKLHKVLPLHPQDLLQAFHLGTAHRMLDHEGNVAAALEIARKIAGRVVSEDELRRVPETIEKQVNQKSLVDRVLSVFSIVNIVWFVAIVGLAFTTGPFLYTVVRPIHGLLVHISEIVLEYAIATLQQLKPLDEFALYAACVYLLVESSRYVRAGIDAYSMVGPMTALTSAAVFGLSWCYTTAKNSDNSGNVELFMTMSWSLASMFFLPAAAMHQSSLLGYGVVAAAACATGFSAYSSGLVTMIGFSSKNALMRGAVGCGTMSVASFAIELAGARNAWTAPLVGPLSVVGTTVYLLALDIQAFQSRDVVSHAFYAANLVAITAGGHLAGLVGAANVAKTFGGLAIFTLFCENAPRNNKEAFTVWIFCLFATLYGGSLYVSRNPELIVSLMSGGRA